MTPTKKLLLQIILVFSVFLLITILLEPIYKKSLHIPEPSIGPYMNDDYVLVEIKKDGRAVGIIRCNKEISQFIGNPNYPNIITLSTSLKTNNNGFPTTEENAKFFEIEDKIIEYFHHNNNSLYAGAITGEGLKRYMIYTFNVDNFKDKFNKVQQTVSNYSFKIVVQEDKGWDSYKKFCP